MYEFQIMFKIWRWKKRFVCEKYRPNGKNVINKIVLFIDFTVVSGSLDKISELVAEIQDFG